jgi:hypothetical protein
MTSKRWKKVLGDFGFAIRAPFFTAAKAASPRDIKHID